jgi:hypothetical protein
MIYGHHRCGSHLAEDSLFEDESVVESIPGRSSIDSQF